MSNIKIFFENGIALMICGIIFWGTLFWEIYLFTRDCSGDKCRKSLYKSIKKSNFFYEIQKLIFVPGKENLEILWKLIFMDQATLIFFAE